MADLVIHVGIRKSATTWLQDRFFKDLPSVNYIGKTTDDYPQWLIDLHYLDDFEFSRRSKDIRDSLLASLHDYSVNILSSEAFTNTAVIWQQAHRIKDIFPNARIIITLRDPIDTLISHYKLDVAEGRYHLPLDEYLDWSRTPYDLAKRAPIFLPDFFYDEMITLYRSLFGENRVCILRYEDMINSSDSFFSSLFTFIGLESERLSTPRLTEKLNAGASNCIVRNGRARNVFEITRTHYPTALRHINMTNFLPDIESDIVSESLRTRLQTYFKGKCCGYY